MNHKIISFFLLIILFATISCEKEIDQQNIDRTNIFEQEKKAIIEVLNSETKAAFNRDYIGWKKKWIHEPYVAKTYINFSDSTMTETLGWDEVNNFVKIYIEEHPEPDPIPTLIDDINVRLYGTGASVNYEQTDPERGLKRETRLMEKVNGKWKIAGMHTTIYGFKKKE